MNVAPDRQPLVDAEACVRADVALDAFDLLGRRWTGVLLGTLSRGPAVFRAISRAVDGISDSVLSDRLCELCNVGLAIGTVDEGLPIPAAYELTDAGRALCLCSSRSPVGPSSTSRHSRGRVRSGIGTSPGRVRLTRARYVTSSSAHLPRNRFRRQRFVTSGSQKSSRLSGA